jgi:hypothetical protein
MARALTIALVLIPILFAEARSPDGPERLLEQVAEGFIALASQSWSDFSVCEHRSKSDDKRAFLHKSFGRELFPASASIAWKELQTSEEGASSTLHLGLIAVTFQDPKEAIGVHTRLTAAKHPYLKNTKILTRYKALLQGSTVLIVYSETYLHEALQRFFTAVALPP